MTNLTIFGNLTKEVEIATTESGTKYARFTVASDRSRDKKASTDFFHVTAFADATNGLEQLAKGAFVKMTGYIRTSEFEGRQTIDIIARFVERYADRAEEVPA
ncbi:MAG: single-stranded DNA-binding protein [Candidatus Cybelea sp.]